MECRSLNDALELVRQERARQERQHGDDSIIATPMNPDRWVRILAEELGEVSQAARYVANHPDEWTNDGIRNLELELIQVAAVAIACVECLWIEGEGV